MQRFHDVPADRAFLLLGVLFILAFAFPPTLASGDGCTSADVNEPFVLPDGSVHPAGKVTLCHSHEHSPVKSMHRVLVDRQPVGMFFSERQIIVDESKPSPYYLIFERSSVGPLRLVGYGRPSGAETATYLLDRPIRVDVRDSVGAATR